MIMEEDKGYIKGKVESIEDSMNTNWREQNKLSKRISILEKHTFAFWIIGPVVLGAIAFLKDIKKLFGY